MNPRLLWSPSAPAVEHSNLKRYMHWLKSEHGLVFDDYRHVWEWSVAQPCEFWESLWHYFGIIFDGRFDVAMSNDAMPHTRWFEGTRVNYAEHIFQKYTDLHPAIIFQSEFTGAAEISWAELKRKVAALQQYLLKAGVQPGDTVAAYLPSAPEATIGLLAASSIGAIWSSCSPDFGKQSVLDRFAQINPKVLLTITEYHYGGKTFDKTDVVHTLRKELKGLTKTVVVGGKHDIPGTDPWQAVTSSPSEDLHFVRVPFAHPLWVLFSSGTTGLPKAITHSHGGILLEHLKYLTFHNDVKPGERFFWYTTTGWMMWNYIQSSLLCGATLVLYDGSPGFPDLSVLWKFAAQTRINHFGTSASFILSNLKRQIHPARDFDLKALRSISSTGSTLPPEGFDWVYASVGDVWLASMSGGTDVCTAFVGGNPTWPVYAGEIQCRALGCKVEAYSEDGTSLASEVGEMVITAPMPSMPVFFWNDPGFKRYKESYFEMFPNVWRQGDWTEITPRNGVIIYGRSDATLNRGGVRIGTSEIYRAVDKVTEVRDSLIVCIEKPGGEFYMPLFVQLQEGISLNEELIKKINHTIRQDYSPRHVPDQIIAVPEVPYTMSGKKTETPVKKILMGKPAENIVSAGALRNPESLKFFIEFYKQQHLT